MPRKILRILGAFVSFSCALFGGALLARGLELVKSPMVAWPDSTVYQLELQGRDVYLFYIGCVLVAASLTFFWTQRLK